MQHSFFADRRALVAASFAGLSLLVFAPKSYGMIPNAPGPQKTIDRQISHKDPATAEPNWAFQRGQSHTQSPTRLRSQIRGENIPETDTRVAAADLPASPDWTDEVTFGSGVLAALVMAGGMTVILRHRRAVSTIR